MKQKIVQLKKYVLNTTACEFLIDKMIKFKYRERTISLGSENQDKTFYVIRTMYATGIFSACIMYISHLMYAEKMGYIPVMDEYSLRNFMADANLVKKKNVWEMIYKQPGNYSLKDIKNSKNIILCNALNTPKDILSMNWQKYDFGKAGSQFWNEKMRRYFRFNDTIIEFIRKKYNEIMIKEARILGIAIRAGITYGMQIKMSCANGHPIEMTLEKSAALIRQKMKEWNCQYVYCTCDGEEAINFMKAEFGEKLLYIKRNRTKYYEKGEPMLLEDIAYQSSYDRTLTYIAEIALLSQCTALIGGRNGGTIMAGIWNDGAYEYCNIQDARKFQVKVGKSYLKENESRGVIYVS